MRTLSRSARAPRLARSAAVLLAAAVAAPVALASPALAATPDFAHPAHPHFPDYRPQTSHGVRHVLVLYETYTDVATPPGRTAAWLATRIFGPGRSMAGYFRKRSFGAVDIEPAHESRGADDGVIVVRRGTRAAWEAETDEQRIRRSLVAANPFIDYARYDEDGDGAVEPTELTIMKVEVQPGDDGSTIGIGGAATRFAEPGGRLDGVSFDWQPAGLANTTTNLISIAHEMMHAGFGMGRDWYQFGIDGFDIMGATLAGSEFYEGVNAWHAMHLGWIHPTVVLHDGYRTLRSYTRTGAALLLYDPTKGRQHYWLLENRTLDRGSYDEDPAAMRGLNIWRIDETRYLDDAPEATPISRVRPCGVDGCPDGWYFSTFDGASLVYPERTASVPWNDGTPGTVAVRAIGAAGPMMLVYVDVPGPGALVDCFARGGDGHRRTYDVSRGGALSIRLPIMNTGDAVQTLHTAAVSPPAGLRVTADTDVALAPHLDATAELTLRAGAGMAPGRYLVRIRTTESSGAGMSSGCRVVVHVR